MQYVVQWATILSPIIAVVIAWWTSRNSAKDTEKKLTALEVSTAKQVESLKDLQAQQIEASIKQVELEIEKYLILAKSAKQEWEGIQGINNSGMAHMVQWKEMVMKDFQEKKPERDYQLYNEFIKKLEKIKQGLETHKKKLN